MMRYRKITSIILLVLVLIVSGSVLAQDGRLNVVATTTQAYDIVTILGGDLIEVTGLMGAGVDPHLYQPTEANIAAMQQADLVLYSGLRLEGQFDEVFEGLGERNIRTYAISDPVLQAGFVFDNFGGEQGVADPHFWFDPRNWQLTVEGVAEVLGQMDPENADIYFENAVEYNTQLDSLYDWAFEAMSQIPPAQRTLVTSHDAFQYFGAAFGWDVRGLQGISTEDEAGVADVQDLVGFVVENAIPVLYVESSVPPDAIEAVIDAVRNEGSVVGLGVRELFSDAMGETETFGGTYVGMLATNVATIVQSSGFALPDWPNDLDPAIPDDIVTMEDMSGA